MDISKTFTKSNKDRQIVLEYQLKKLSVKVLSENIDMELPITLEECSSHTINRFSRVYHEHMLVWMPQIDDDSLFCRREPCNEQDEYAAAIVVPLFLRCLTSFFACPNRMRVATFQHSHKKQIVWKHGPNWPFYAVMLRTSYTRTHSSLLGIKM